MLIDFRQLWPRWNIKPTGVLHVGANVGEEAPVYLELGVKRQVWIEANPYICDRLQANIKNNPEAIALNFAATDENGQVILHESNNGSQSSSLLELGTHKIQHPDVHYVRDIPVRGQRIDCLILPPGMYTDIRCDIDGLDFLNIDVQGAELKVLRGMGDVLRQFKWVYMEVNREEVYVKGALIEDVDMYLLGFGFKRVETKWCGGWGDSLFIKNGL